MCYRAILSKANFRSRLISRLSVNGLLRRLWYTVPKLITAGTVTPRDMIGFVPTADHCDASFELIFLHREFGLLQIGIKRVPTVNSKMIRI